MTFKSTLRTMKPNIKQVILNYIEVQFEMINSRSFPVPSVCKTKFRRCMLSANFYLHASNNKSERHYVQMHHNCLTSCFQTALPWRLSFLTYFHSLRLFPKVNKCTWWFASVHKILLRSCRAFY